MIKLPFSFKPFPYGFVPDAVSPELLQEMRANFPPRDLAVLMYDDRPSGKLSLSDIKNPSAYHAWIEAHPLWKQFQARLEFSWIPADGGFINPHTDAANKLISIVVPVGEWNEAWGGETEMMTLKNWIPVHDGKPYAWDEFDTLFTAPFRPGSANFFMKTHCSWHGVRPCRGPANAWRMSINLNVLR
jgi:hypothetical protein